MHHAPFLTAMSDLSRLFLLAALCLLSGCNSLSTMLFFPDQHYYRTPSVLGVAYQEVALRTEDGEVLHNWLLKPSGEPKASVLFLHGNGENISTHMGSIAWLSQQGYEVLLMDYRGYGQSSGVATLANVHADIYLAHSWLSQRSDRPLVMFGQSMGGALAITYLAQLREQQVTALASASGLALKARNFEALVSESAPASWPQIAREVLAQHWLTWPLQLSAWLLPHAYDAEDNIGKLKNLPSLLIHSKDDRVVPFHHSEQLRQQSPASEFIQAHGRHIAAMADKAVRDQIVAFIARSIDTRPGIGRDLKPDKK